MDSFYICQKWSLSLEGVSCVTLFTESGNSNFWHFFKKISALTLKKKSTVLDGFFPYLAQMITSMRCITYDIWPLPISSRSFDHDFENRVRSVTFSVRDRLFPYLPQIITTIRGCVKCLVYNKILKFKIFGSHLEKIYNSACILSIFGTNHH